MDCSSKKKNPYKFTAAKSFWCELLVHHDLSRPGVCCAVATGAGTVAALCVPQSGTRRRRGSRGSVAQGYLPCCCR